MATELATKDEAAANAVIYNIQKGTLLEELSKQGLSGAKLVSTTLKVTVSSNIRGYL